MEKSPQWADRVLRGLLLGLELQFCLGSGLARRHVHLQSRKCHQSASYVPRGQSRTLFAQRETPRRNTDLWKGFVESNLDQIEKLTPKHLAESARFHRNWSSYKAHLCHKSGTKKLENGSWVGLFARQYGRMDPLAEQVHAASLFGQICGVCAKWANLVVIPKDDRRLTQVTFFAIKSSLHSNVPIFCQKSRL